MSRIASDGLPARENGEYAKAKLEWLERYLRGGLSATQSKWHRVYVDLFAGPGLNIDPNSGIEFLGGATRAVQLIGNNRDGSPFTSAFLVNLDEIDHAALSARIDRLSHQHALRVPRTNIRLLHGDANEKVHQIMQEIPLLDWVFVFADIEHPRQLPFTTVQALKKYNHRSVDLYVLFPLEMVIQRALRFRTDRRPKQINTELTNFFGTEAWREIDAARKTPAAGPEFRQALEDLYCDQLCTLWKEAGRVTRIKLAGDRTLYRMVFAASNEAALNIANNLEDQSERSPNLELF